MLMPNITIGIIRTYFEDAKKGAELVRCKWVNDIFIGSLKVCGSLIRFSQEDGKYYF
jgi:biotin-(acetyl-CoA carboxylase) ligase